MGIRNELKGPCGVVIWKNRFQKGWNAYADVRLHRSFCAEFTKITRGEFFPAQTGNGKTLSPLESAVENCLIGVAGGACILIPPFGGIWQPCFCAFRRGKGIRIKPVANINQNCGEKLKTTSTLNASRISEWSPVVGVVGVVLQRCAYFNADGHDVDGGSPKNAFKNAPYGGCGGDRITNGAITRIGAGPHCGWSRNFHGNLIGAHVISSVHILDDKK